MYILWSQQEYDDKYVIYASNNLDKLKHFYLKFCEKNKDDYTFNKNLIEKELNSFSLYSRDCDFYFSKIDADAEKQIYIFTFEEDGEGQDYYNQIYFNISNNKESLFEIATEYFITESKKTSKKDIDKMLEKLKTDGEYSIPHGRTYVCDMKIFQFCPCEL